MERRSHREASHIPSDSRARTSGNEEKYLFGKAIYAPGGHCGPRIQPDFQLVVLIRGSLRVTVNGVVYDLAPGEAILQHPSGSESYRFSTEVESTHTWCQVAPGVLSPEDRGLLLRTHGVAQAPSSIHLLIEEGLAIQGLGSEELHYAMAALSRACLLRFAAHIIARDHRNATAPLHPALEKALDIASVHYAEIRSAEDLAQRVGISASRLRALCREARGESPSDMIWRLKLEHAIQLIRSTGLTLGEIAEDCGYANPFHLSRSVLRHTGYAPRQLREVERKGK